MPFLIEKNDISLFEILLFLPPIVFIITMIGIIIQICLVNRDNKKRQALIKQQKLQYQQLVLKFSQQYAVSITQDCIIQETDQTQENCFSLALPHWKYATKTGTADKRYSNNNVVYEDNHIYFDNYIISSKSIKAILKLVHELRKNGIRFSENPLETQKRCETSQHSTVKTGHQSLHSIISNFEEHPTEFEIFCAELFRTEGYQAEVTSATNDGGYDIFLRDPQTNETALVECKCYDFFNKIGRPLLQKLYGANASIQANRLIFITTSDFSKQALDYGHEVDIEMINGKKLLDWVNQSTPNIDVEETDVQNEEKLVELTEEDIIALLPEDLKSMLK